MMGFFPLALLLHPDLGNAPRSSPGGSSSRYGTRQIVRSNPGVTVNLSATAADQALVADLVRKPGLTIRA